MIERYRMIQRQKAAGQLDASGFTLIELLIVIVVLGILAAVVVFALGGVTGQSAIAACNADAKTVEVAVAAEQAETPAVAPTDGANSNLVPTYLRSFPNNTGTNYTIGIDTANNEVSVTTTGTNAGTVDYSQQAGGASPTGCYAATTS